MVEYVINKFISNPQSPSGGILSVKQQLNDAIEKIAVEVPLLSFDQPAKLEWTEEELDALNFYFAQVKNTKSAVAEIARYFKENGNTFRSHQEIVDQLINQSWVTQEEAANYYAPTTARSVASPAEVLIESSEPMDDVQIVCQKLTLENPKAILWLQQVLLECSSIKFHVEEGVCSNSAVHRLLRQRSCRGLPRIMEPVALIHIREYWFMERSLHCDN